MANEKPDWVWVKLNAKGEEIAKGEPLTVAGAIYQFTFKPGEPQRVTRAFDWGHVLSREHFNGEKIFELCDPPAEGEHEGGQAQSSV